MPVLPIICVAAAIGYESLIAVGRRGSIIASALLLLAAVWWVADYKFSPNQSRYYFEDTAYTADYDAMKQLALKMRTIKPGVVLGYAYRLDAGTETEYYHDLPLVVGRGGLKLFGRDEIEKLVRDFHITHIWTDESSINRLREWFPAARVLMDNPPFSVLELTRDE